MVLWVSRGPGGGVKVVSLFFFLPFPLRPRPFFFPLPFPFLLGGGVSGSAPGSLGCGKSQPGRRRSQASKAARGSGLMSSS